MRYYDGATNQVGNRKNFEEFVGAYTLFMAFSEMIADTVIAPKYHRGYESEQLFGFNGQGTLLVGAGIQGPEAFKVSIALRKNLLIHFLAVGIEFVYDRHK